jgi:hypothetical protein
MLRKTLCLAAAALFTQAASASVVYSWQQLEHANGVPDGLHLELEFTDAAVAAGSFALDLRNDCWRGYCEQQQDSLLALRYWYAGADGKQAWNRIDYRYLDETRYGFGTLSLALDFLPEGRLRGAIFASNGESDFSMQSDGAVFTLLSAGSDQPDGCGFAYPSCAGERGLLGKTGKLLEHAQAQDQANPVPEPAAPASLAIGALAAWFARRRGTGRREQ